MKYKVEGLNTLSKQFHEFQIKAGFTDSNITQRLMLVHSEITEAFDAYRNDKYAPSVILLNTDQIDRFDHPALEADIFKDSFERRIKDTFQDEIADAIIRLLAICGENNIDIERHIQLKMKYNELRGFKYGGKKF